MLGLDSAVTLLGGKTEAGAETVAAAVFTFRELGPVGSALAAGFAAGRALLVCEVTLTGGAAGGGVEDLGLSPAVGDGALTSSTGLLWKEKYSESDFQDIN